MFVAGNVRRAIVAVVALLVIIVPALRSTYQQGLAADAAITGLLVLSLVVLTGFVGQISFCQYSFAALGAFTVGALVSAHHWSFWAALPLGVTFAAVAGVVVGFVALRLSGLFLAILTVAVALATDRFLLAGGTWNSFSGQPHGWTVARPRVVGVSLQSEYRYYLLAIAVFGLASLLVWNMRTGKTGRVLRAIRESETAAATVGLSLTAWKLAAFAFSAGLAGLAGCLLAGRVGSVSAGSYDFTHSVLIAGATIVMGAGSVGSAVVAGFFIVFGPDLVHGISLGHLGTQWFPVVLGSLVVIQLLATPTGFVTDTERRVAHAIRIRLAPDAGSA
jgi:ABC-type branched-subunit amino acid transport system permease subunit